MSNRNLQTLQAEIDQIDWYHEFDFGHGLKAKTKHDTEDHRAIWNFIGSNLDQVDFGGKTVLDIGAWDGYWSFEAEKRGASAVLATDDVSQNWAKGTGIKLAKRLLQSKIEVNQKISVYDIASLNQKFDIILFLGVYYHLLDPFYAFSQIRHCCHENTIVLVDGPVGQTIPYNSSFTDFRYGNCEFLPGMGMMNQLVEAVYLVQQKTSFIFPGNLPTTSQPTAKSAAGKPARSSLKTRLKRAYQAFLEEPKAPTADVQTKDISSNRLFLECKPFTGTNRIHKYKPPFNLHIYDNRQF